MSLWKRLGVQGDASAAYEDLVARYSESHRAYHTLEHIRHCLDELGFVRHLAVDPSAVELALWYHDAIYDTRAEDNEAKSAELALRVIQIAMLPDDFGQKVASLILATRHIDPPVDPDAKLVADIDLSSLGIPEDAFYENTLRIRKEYEWVSEDEFVSGRSAILKSFLNRPTIYSTQFFRDKYEVQARLNIARSLARLRMN